MYKVPGELLEQIKLTLIGLSSYLIDEEQNYKESSASNKKTHIWNEVKEAKRIIDIIENNYNG